MNIFVFEHNSDNFYNKQDGCLVFENHHFYCPEYITKLSYTSALLFKIVKSGKYIKPEFSSRYYSFKGTAINIYAENFISEANSNVLSFFKSSLLDKSTFIKECKNNIDFVSINNTVLIENIENKIFQLSKFATLKTGDIVLFELTNRILINNDQRISYSFSGLEFPEVVIE